MIDQLKQNAIAELQSLPKDRYENIFNVYLSNKSEDKYYFYNILKKISIDTDNIDPAVFKFIKINRRIPWTTVSYQEYKTQHLWWLILAANGIKNPIILPQIGDVLRVIRSEYVNTILNQISE
jgi:hypothetical protein